MLLDDKEAECSEPTNRYSASSLSGHNVTAEGYGWPRFDEHTTWRVSNNVFNRVTGRGGPIQPGGEGARVTANRETVVSRGPWIVLERTREYKSYAAGWLL